MEQLVKLKLAPEHLYTKEKVVFSANLPKVNFTKPISVMIDPDYNFVLQDGNHRAVKALIKGELIEAELIGTTDIRVSKDIYYHLVDQVKIIELIV